MKNTAKLIVITTIGIISTSAYTAPLEQKVDPQKIMINQDGGVLSAVKPHYPKKAQRESIEGWVKLVVDVNTAGELAEVTVVSAYPKRIFEKAAEQSLHEWQFKQKMVNGQAVPYQLTQTIDFKLINYTMKDGQIVIDEENHKEDL
ncbi:energy transducer TonB [Marinicella sp. S1101]|uniref:energy transducer TonB n=1 Tax=Marinicella marina TaxID=2996016 RepID=UPI002260A565|nr:energy transducer TonB [Marinicella marina]MCX7552297.1 energy transducer TonB [Marinicella marina]MDJ1139173.1 energy transducer TonB [Marinicella marina]